MVRWLGWVRVLRAALAAICLVAGGVAPVRWHSHDGGARIVADAPAHRIP